MKKNGFTLLELLGIIILLAVLAIITTPIITNVVEKAKLTAFRDSVYGMLDAARLITIEGYTQSNNMEFWCDGTECLAKERKLEFRGEVPISGSIVIQDHLITAEYITNGIYCAYGTTSDLKVQKGCELFDESGPILDETKMKLTSSSDKIMVILEEGFALDPESDILKYRYTLYLNDQIVEEKESKLPNTAFLNLQENTLYKVKVTVFNRASTTSTIEKEISTKEIVNPIVQQIEQIPEMTTYATKRVLKITYTDTNIDEPEYYFKSTSKAYVENGIVSMVCGNKVEPEDCTEKTVTTLEENTWYKTNQKEVIITYKEEGNLYSLTSDKTNMIGGSTYNVANMDTGIPTIIPIDPEVKFIIGENRSIESLFHIDSHGPLPLTTTCKVNSNIVTNLNQFEIGDYVITCETVKSSEVKANASIKLKIVSNTCSADTIGEVIGGYICSAPNPNCFTCPSGKEKVKLENGTYTCK